MRFFLKIRKLGKIRRRDFKQLSKEQRLVGSSAEVCERFCYQRKKGITLKILGLHALNLCPKFAICQHCSQRSCTTAQILKKVKQVAAQGREEDKKRQSLKKDRNYSMQLQAGLEGNVTEGD